MKAWLLKNVSDITANAHPLQLVDIPTPDPQQTEILIKVSCCGVCHTEIDEIEGRTPPSVYPVVPGHQVVGRIVKCGSLAKRFKTGDRVGVAWIFSACGECEYCKSGRENLCPYFKATGRDKNGGYAPYMTVDERFAYTIPSVFLDEEAAPLLCAGAIGYRSLKLTELKDGQTLGLSGFGASGHLVLKMVKHLYPHSRVLVFARNTEEQNFARQLGAVWAGDISAQPGEKANAIIDTTPVWSMVTGSMLQLKPGGRLVINAIRKESHDIAELERIRYQDHLWMEKEIKTVANITRTDVEEFLTLAAAIPIKPEIEKYAFDRTNEAIVDLKRKHVRGAKVLIL